MNMSKKVAVVLSSTRPGRIGANITNWAMGQLTNNSDVTFEVVDLKDWDLPILDEPMPPMMQQYQHDHTKKWSAKIKEYAGYIFVTPEYNAGYPAGLKNAIDYLYVEWKDKPVSIISYGWSGGASANKQLQQVFERIGMKITKTLPQLVMTKEMFGEDHQIKNVDEAFSEYKNAIQEAQAELIELI